MKVLIDADIFIALINQHDALFSRASKLVSLDFFATSELFVSYDVVAEAVTKLSYFMGKKQALLLLAYLQKMDIKIIYPNPEFYTLASEIFQKIKSKRVSLTDCMNMAIYQKLKLDCIFSFDQIYQKQKILLFQDFLTCQF